MLLHVPFVFIFAVVLFTRAEMLRLARTFPVLTYVIPPRLTLLDAEHTMSLSLEWLRWPWAARS